MTESGTISVYHWKYDDGSRGYAVRYNYDSQKNWLTAGDCANKSEFKKACATIENKYPNMNIQFKKRRVAAGLDAVRPSNFPRADAEKSAAGIKAIKQLLDSSGSMPESYREYLYLVSAILAGYCARVCSNYYKVERIQDKYKYAPVLSVSYADYAYYVLEQIENSFTVNTSVANSEEYMFTPTPIWSKYRPFLPHKQTDRSVTDCIYLKLPGRDYRLMPQFRDTTLLIHCRFFPGSEIAELQRKNIWTGLVLYDAPAKKLLSTPVRISGSILALSNCLWDTKALNYIVQRYVSYLARKSDKKKWSKRIEKYFQDAERVIAQHNASVNEKPILRAQKYQLSLQLLALRLLLDSCQADGGLSEEDAYTLLMVWYQAMLPGCSLEKVQISCELNDWDGPEPFQTQFEAAICQILQADEFEHICFSKNNICPKKDNSNNSHVEYWAYVSHYKPKGKDRAPFLALRLRRTTFEKLFPKYCENYRGKNLFEDFRDLDAEYKEGTKARMYLDEDDATRAKTVDALILNIERMLFLPQKIIDRLYEIAANNEEADNSEKA